MRISDWSSDVCSSDLTGSFNLRVDLPTEQSPAKLRENHGGVWGEYPEYPANDWRLEVENHDTRIGYWEWVAAKIEQAELENAEEGDTVQTDRSVNNRRDNSLGRPTYLTRAARRKHIKEQTHIHAYNSVGFR